MLKEIKNDKWHYFEDKQGRMQGEYTSWHFSNQIEIKCFYVDGNLRGEFKSWWSNGERRRHCIYVDNELHGKYMSWHSNRQPWIHCFYDNSKIHGEYKNYWESGKLYRHCFYVNGDEISFDKIPYPETEEDCMYFKLKYNLPLLPETVC